jgi:SAM-dependent methyltransferase
VQRSLLGLIVCPRCRQRVSLDVFAEESLPDGGSEPEVMDGALRCGDCAESFPIIAGIPRLLSAPLLAQLRPRHAAFFAAHPEFRGDVGAEHALADTLESFTRQRLDLDLPGPELAEQWHRNLERNLEGALALDELRGRRVLDVGCGFGRHMFAASDHGAEVVGIDLSGGVEVAYRNTRERANCHVVQGDVSERPFRDGVFDVVWSFGVLHHMPDPAGGFRTLVDFVRPDGLIAIWVYGYRGMRLSYRLSHMRALHAVTRRLSGASRLRTSQTVAALLSVLYWAPLRALEAVGLRDVVQRLPLADYVRHSWRARVAAVHDRLSTPITHFHERDELLEWLERAGLSDIRVADTDRRGWRASGRRTAVPAEHVRPHLLANGAVRHRNQSHAAH